MQDSFTDFRNTLTSGQTYLFHGKIDTPQRHYQIILNNEIDDTVDVLYFSVATSQIEKKKRFF